MTDLIDVKFIEHPHKMKSTKTNKKRKVLTKAIRLTIKPADLNHFKDLDAFIPLEKFWENGIVQLERDLGAIWLEREDDGLTIIYKALVFRAPIKDGNIETGSLGNPDHRLPKI